MFAIAAMDCRDNSPAMTASEKRDAGRHRASLSAFPTPSWPVGRRPNRPSINAMFAQRASPFAIVAMDCRDKSPAMTALEK
ncbi:MAG TPA: hypothetical protein VGG10_07350 [Rhizomicrobium sp.]|jgi:hypothetical protein